MNKAAKWATLVMMSASSPELLTTYMTCLPDNDFIRDLHTNIQSACNCYKRVMLIIYHRLLLAVYPECLLLLIVAKHYKKNHILDLFRRLNIK